MTLPKKIYKTSKAIASLFILAAGVISSDRLTVYAAQGSFFAVISAVPLTSLIISVTGLLIPGNLYASFDTYKFPPQIVAVIGSVLEEIRNAPNVSFLSLSALATLWAASKVISAIRSGLLQIFGAKPTGIFFIHTLRSLLGTLVFIVLVIALIVVLLFGGLAAKLIENSLVSGLILELRFPFAFVFMCMLFSIAYHSAAKRSVHFPGGFLRHLPGAVFSSVGWILFSHIYSLYLYAFPGASYIYGGLGAICLSMLWVYFCSVILLLGAELNKLLVWICRRKNKNDGGKFK